MIKVLAVDDHPLLREGIAALVNAESDMKLFRRVNLEMWERLTPTS
jgi:DNA-binding NarL/FixJ family response regulator